MRIPSLAATALVAGVVTVGLALSARAEDPEGSGSTAAPVLHEYLPGVRGDEVDLILGQGQGPGAAGRDGDAPSLLYQGALLSMPDDDGPVDGGREVTMSAVPGDGRAAESPGRRSPTFRPDRQTELEGTLGYYASFNPTVAPFKRVSAFDAVSVEADGTPVLSVSQPDLVEPVPVVAPSAGADEPRDRFWGSVVLDFADGARVPLPTPGPDARILWWEATPSADLRFERDAAENAFVLAPDDLDPTEPVRLAYLVDVPRSYFGGAIPDVANDALAAAASPLDPELGVRARGFAGELGVRRGDPLPKTLRRLVRHFRSFEESAVPPPDSGDVYLDLARGKKGICRHRAYAFVVTALALGMPSRLAMNEAHSWVEVALPGKGWLRIDLGGAAAGLEAHGAEDRVLHRPGEPDTLPKPPAYRRSYSQLQGDVRGLPRGPVDPARRGPAPGADAATPGTPRPPTRTWGGRGRRAAVHLAVDALAYTAFRGRALTVSGRATDAGDRGLAGLRIEAVLQVPGEERLLGVAVTNDQGFYRGDFGVPPALPAGTYRLDLRFPGDAAFAPATIE